MRSHSLPLALEDDEQSFLRRTSSGSFRVALRGRPGTRGDLGTHRLTASSPVVKHPSPLGSSESRFAPSFDKFEIFFGKNMSVQVINPPINTENELR